MRPIFTDEELGTEKWSRGTIIDGRFRLEKEIGAGSYGYVWSAKVLQSKNGIVVKRVHARLLDKYATRRLVREVYLLLKLNHLNIVRLRDIIVLKHSPYLELGLIFEQLDCDLRKSIMLRQILPERTIKVLMFQLFLGLQYIHSAGVIHRDIKPSNLLINSNGLLQICDFGMARPLINSGDVEGGQTIARQLTRNVQTRYYRAPEVLMYEAEYKGVIDIWSCGCVFGELLQCLEGFQGETGPLFQGESASKASLRAEDILGTENPTQLGAVVSKLGLCHESQIDFVTCEEFKKCIRSRFGHHPPVRWVEDFSHVNEMGLDLLNKCLQFNPNHRITAKESLLHPFFDSIRNEAMHNLMLNSKRSLIICPFEGSSSIATMQSWLIRNSSKHCQRKT